MPDACLLPVPDVDSDEIYNVYAMRYGSAPRRRVHENFMFRDLHDGPMPMDFFIWILRNRHRTVIVDTGFSHRAAGERHYPIDIDPVEALDRLGIPAAGVEDVIITHLHFDHAGNIGKFPKAQFHVQDAEVEYATGRCMCQPTLRGAFDVEDIVDLVRHTYAGRVTFHAGEASPLPGITLHHLPGHSKGVQAVRVGTPRGPVLLASDVSHYYANLVRRSPFRLTVNAAETLASYSALRRIGGSLDRIVPGHDPKVRRLYPLEIHGGIEVALLHREPRSHTEDDLARIE